VREARNEGDRNLRNVASPSSRDIARVPDEQTKRRHPEAPRFCERGEGSPRKRLSWGILRSA